MWSYGEPCYYPVTISQGAILTKTIHLSNTLHQNQKRELMWMMDEAQMISCPLCNRTGIFDFMPADVLAPKLKCEAKRQGEGIEVK